MRAVLGLLLLLRLAAGEVGLAQYVLTSTGSVKGGNTFPGVSWPLGIVKLGPDLFTGSDSYSGYQPTGNFTGFSMLHESGTGGAPKYGVVSQLPVAASVDNPLGNISDTRASPDLSRVGYYRSHLASGIIVELAATTKAGLYNYTFPPNVTVSSVVVDVSHVLSSYRGQGLEQHYLGGNMTITKNDSGTGALRYEGHGIYDNGWNRAGPWKVYFCGFFDSEPLFQTFVAADAASDTLAQYSSSNSVQSTARLGAVFSFHSTKVRSRVGISFISSDNACQNVNDQIPAGSTVSGIEELTKEAWNSQVLSKLTTTETNVTKLEQLYTALYSMHLLPTNKTGENPLWSSSEPYYDDIFTFWDTHRCTTSLFHILQPIAFEELVRSLVDIWRHEGFMSDGRSSFWNGAVQGGSNCDNVLADAYVKGVNGGVCWEDAYQAMVTNAELVPAPNNDTRDPTGSTKEGRSALPDWLHLGYLTTAYARSVSRAVEYSANDFALYQVAKGLGKTQEAERYLIRSRFWRNHWNINMSALGHTGFLGPINATGGFVEQDPLSCGGCYWQDYYYQALPWEYSFNAHHDLSTMIALSGGPEAFVDRLGKSFTSGLVGGNEQFGHTIFNPGNEPSFGTPYLYNFVNRQDLSVKRSRFIAKSYYSPTPGGLPGNSDAGAMESWLLWNMIGLYPITGQTTFLIGSPWFSDLTISLGVHKYLRITATNGSETAFYVQSLRVNGEAWDKSWLSWSDVFADGGRLDYVLGPEPTNWTTGPPPPSPASEWSVDDPARDILLNLPTVESLVSFVPSNPVFLLWLLFCVLTWVVPSSLFVIYLWRRLQRSRGREPSRWRALRTGWLPMQMSKGQ